MNRVYVHIISLVREAIILITILGSVIVSDCVIADVKLPAVISDNMVLQQDTEVALWGWASPGETITIKAEWSKEVKEAIADETGSWIIHLATPSAGGPYSITISGATSITLENVLVGEVWTCSGQSNMEMRVGSGAGLGGVVNEKQELAAADYPNIRLFTVPNTVSAHRRIDTNGSWVQCSRETVAVFSATGYFFGRHLHQHLDVPIGLIDADWGGTVAQAWMSREAISRFDEFTTELQFLDEVKDPNRRVSITQQRAKQWWGGLDKTSSIETYWMSVAFDDSTWETTELPSDFEAQGISGFDGIVYYRRAIDLPGLQPDVKALIELGPIDDYDDLWINGVHVAATHEAGRWNVPRKYSVPPHILKSSNNVIALRVLDTGGIGGANGQPHEMKLGGGGLPKPISLSGSWKYKPGATVKELPRMPESVRISQNTASVLFNGMIAPLMPYTIRGVIWYQGEANRSTAALYRTLFPALIHDWRVQWGNPNLPFYFVQIAPFRYAGNNGQTALLREAQLMALSTPNTGMVVTMDIGNPNDIHPRNKQEVGRRLSLWARAKTYDEDELTVSGPIYRSMKIENDTIRIRFDHMNGGLILRDSDRSYFIIAGEDRRFVPAKALVEGDSIVVSSELVSHPVAVRYAWEDAPDPNLFNVDGLPASPFRTDNWEK